LPENPVAPVTHTASTAPLAPLNSPLSVLLHISLINAAAFIRALHLPGLHSFTINLNSISTSTRLSTLSNDLIDLSNIPKEYHEFANIFSKSRTDSLAPHCPYDLRINLEEGAQPPVGPIYSLSQTKLAALQEFIDEHLTIGFI
jgi:hypothetical protein